MRSRSMSVHTTSCPASARQAPVTKPTYPQPMTERRKTSSPGDAVPKNDDPVHSKLPVSHCRRIPPEEQSALWPMAASKFQVCHKTTAVPDPQTATLVS